jgi:GDPmannose 4,6-dehydratase
LHTSTHAVANSHADAVGNATALITGITGQDGYYLAKLLLSRGYTVCGVYRRSSSDNMQRVRELQRELPQDGRFSLRCCDVTDGSSMRRVVRAVRPDEIYNLAAMSDVAVSFETPEYCAEVDGVAVLKLLEIAREYDADRRRMGERPVRFYQASTSELFGSAPAPQSESTPFEPRSPYAISKQFAYWCVRNYREAYGLFAANGILFNHESPYRGENFLTRKITRAVAEIVAGVRNEVAVGNLNAVRDWGHAEDYVYAMWLITRAPQPGDYVIASGIATSVRDFIRIAFECVGIDIAWRGEGVREVGVDGDRVLVRVDPALFRPTEVDNLCGDASLARRELGWEGTRSLYDIVREMVSVDMRAVNLP